MRRWIAIVAALLVSPSWAAETTVNWGLKTGPEPRTLCVYDTSPTHTCVPVGQLNSTLHTYDNSISICDVTAYGADPTGAVDSSAAFNACAAQTVNGQKSNIYLPAGTYLLRNRVVVGDQCLYGDGRANTFLHVDQTFNSAADSVIKLASPRVWTTGNAPAPCVHDFDIRFDQPSDQSSRANFKTLAAGCTSGLGGSGCKYPPAIYGDNSGQGTRPRIYNIRIEQAWDGINLQTAAGILIDTIEEGSLNVGLTLDGGHDFGYVSHWEHHSQFGIPSSSVLYTGVYQDGNTYAAKMGATDGIVVNDFRVWQSRVELTTAFTWGSFTDLDMDGNGSTLEINGSQIGGPGIQITNMYASGSAVGVNSHCQIDIGASVLGGVILNNINLIIAGGSIPGLCVAGTRVLVSGSEFRLNTNAVPAVSQTGGNLVITGSNFWDSNPPLNHALPFVRVTGGTVQFLDNTFSTAATGSPELAIGLPDAAGSAVIGNSFNGWAFAAPGPLGAYGPNGQRCTISGASPQTCNGWSGVVTTAALATAALTSTTYVINDTAVSTSSIIRCSIQAYAGAGIPMITQCAPGAGTITATIYNAHASLALNAALTIGFSVQ